MADHAPHDAASGLKLDDENPWPGLASYDEASKNYFYGRDADSAELVRLIRLSPLVMLYGKSGLGKSSMLQAGVFPALRADRYLPVYLRLDYSEDSRLPPLEQAKHRLMEEVHAHGHDAPEPEAGESLWAYLQRLERPIWTADNFPVTPVLVFDQFEEVFSRGGTAQHLAQVLSTMGDLVAGRVPVELVDDRSATKRLNLQSEQYHAVLSFRSDFLADVESWAKAANLPRRESLHLQAMKREPAIDAVQRAGNAVLAPGMATRIVDFLLQKEGGATAAAATDVEPVLLSLCCDQLNRRRGSGKIDEALLKTVGEGILKSFYQEAMKGVAPRAARFVEENLIQGERFRSSFPLAGALAPPDGGNPDGLTRKELDHLTGSRLLRVDPQGGEPRIELIHDRLVGVVREARDARRAVEREEAARQDAAKQEAAKRDAQRLSESETERKELVVQRTILGTVLVLALAGMSFAIYFYRQAAVAKDLASKEALEAKNETKAREETVALLQGRLDVAEARLAAGTPDQRQAQERQVVAAGAAVGSARESAVVAAPAAAAPVLIGGGGPRPDPKADPKADPKSDLKADPKAEGSASLSIDDWRLSSGGCKDGAAAATSMAVFTVTEQGADVIVKADYSGRGNGYTMKGAGTTRPIAKSALGPYVDLDTRHDWSRGSTLSFTTMGVDRVFIVNGRPTRANLMKIRTTCPPG